MNVQILVSLRVDLQFHTLVHLISINIEEIIELIITEDRVLTLILKGFSIYLKVIETPLTILLIQKI